MSGEVLQHHHHHVQGALRRTWRILLLTLLVMVSPTQEETQQAGVRERDITINDLSQDEVREIFEPRSPRKRSLIYPGTKWCGDGNAATDDHDLGSLRELDMCCRDHDHCNDSIPANGTSHGLHNSWTHTSSHCDCDDTFRACLHQTGNSDSEFVGGLYFDIAKCFQYSYPTRCVHTISSRCLKYTYDTTQEKQWQFFDTLPWNSGVSNSRRKHQDLAVNGEDLSEEQVKDIFVPKSRRKRFIYPGTMWCGDGTLAKNYTDLGRLTELDMCCRDHDNCNDSIRANNVKHGLHNPLTHTSSRCDCDASFRKCLHKLKGFDAGIVGGVYFQIAVCFQYSHPSHCISRAESGNRCVKYKYDKSSPKAWQFFDTLPWNYVEPTTTLMTVQYTTATEEPSSQPLSSRAATITVGSTFTVITVAVVVTVLLYNKVKDGNNCCPCKKNSEYKIVSTVGDTV